MFELIVAVDKNYGIGYKDKLPWKCPEELKLFQEKTMDSIIVVGTKTARCLPHLPNRQVICLSRTLPDTSLWKNDSIIISSLSEVKLIEDRKIFIAGGAEVYRTALSVDTLVSKIHISILKDTYQVDTYFDPKLIRNFVITAHTEYEKFDHYVMERAKDGEKQYLDLLSDIVNNGEIRKGRNGLTRSLFVKSFKFDLRNGFPLLTTKKMFLRGILEEFLFFLRGDTDTTILSDKKVRIWEGNTSNEFLDSRKLPYAKGVMGPMYGYQWRHYGAKYRLNKVGKPLETTEGIDQLANVVKLIKTDPGSRRILITTYNPEQAEEGVLYPCHSITIQFYVQDNYLDMFCYNRSQDTFLGVPYNIASSSLLLMVVAKLTHKIPRFFNMTMGDTHLYEEHITQAREQMNRRPFKFPTLKIPDIHNIEDIDFLEANHFTLENYQCHPTIKADMIV